MVEVVRRARIDIQDLDGFPHVEGFGVLGSQLAVGGHFEGGCLDQILLFDVLACHVQDCVAQFALTDKIA